MTTVELVRVYETNLLALGAHSMKVSMDDSEHIRLIRVLIETAETLIEEIGESERKIEASRWELTDYARSLYIKACLEANPGISNKEEYAEESGEIFDLSFSTALIQTSESIKQDAANITAHHHSLAWSAAGAAA